MSRTNGAFRTLLLAATCLALFSAAAFALEGTEVRANIPFAFVVGEKSFPAGEYLFRLDDPTEPEALMVESPDGTRHDFALTETDTLPREEAAKESKLVFDRYGNDHYLAEIWIAGHEQGRMIPMSEIRRERVASLEHERMSIPLHKVG